MKVTQKQVKEYIKNQLSTNSGWAIKALVRIFEENQTSDEQTSEHTKHDNGIGFSGVHTGTKLPNKKQENSFHLCCLNVTS